MHLRSYKYSSVDKSPISYYILRHYVRVAHRKAFVADLCKWNAAVELLPMWLAPNMVTLLGFCFVLADILILEIYVPDLVGPVRNTLSKKCRGALTHCRHRHGYTSASPLAFGCEPSESIPCVTTD